MASEVACAVAALARASKRDDASEINDRRRDLAAAKISQYVERELAKAPPLTDDQKVRLAALFGGAR